MGEFDATIAAAGYRDTKISQEHASQKNRGGSQLNRDQNKNIESTWEQKKKGLGESQLSRDSNITNKGHMRCNRWVISMQRQHLLAIGTPKSLKNMHLRKRGVGPS